MGISRLIPPNSTVMDKEMNWITRLDSDVRSKARVTEILSSYGITSMDNFSYEVFEGNVIIKFSPDFIRYKALNYGGRAAMIEELSTWETVIASFDYEDMTNTIKIKVPLKESLLNITHDYRRQLMDENPPVVCSDGIYSAGAYFSWSWQGCGFGQLSFSKRDDGKFHCMNEGMGPESVRKLLHALADAIADEIILDE